MFFFFKNSICDIRGSLKNNRKFYMQNKLERDLEANLSVEQIRTRVMGVN